MRALVVLLLALGCGPDAREVEAIATLDRIEGKVRGMAADLAECRARYTSLSGRYGRLVETCRYCIDQEGM